MILKRSSTPNLDIALIHYPVVNKNGEEIASAVTNLDLHDIARAAMTFGVKTFYIVTPLQDQMRLVTRIVEHWTEGIGGTYNPTRKRALELIRIKPTLEDVIGDAAGNDTYKTIVSSAKERTTAVSFNTMRDRIKDGQSYLLLLGTAWGLSETFVSDADFVLEPVRGITEYNHLSVRCAAAIILDRLIGEK